ARADAEEDRWNDREQDQEGRRRVRMRELGNENDERRRDRVRGGLRQDLRRPDGEECAIAKEADVYGLLDLRQWSGLVRRSLWPARDEPLDVALDGRTRHEHAVLAGGAAQADVRAQPNDAPGVPAARMRFAEDHDVVEIERKRSLCPRWCDARFGHSREFSLAGYRSGVVSAGRSSADSLVTSNRVPL